MASSPFTKRGIWCMSFAIIVVLILIVNHLGGGEYVAQHAQSYRTSSSDALMESIMNETLGFEKILVINMKTRTDHRDAMALAASLTGLKLDFMEAATNVTAKVLPPGGADRHFPPGHLGVWRSHLNAARYIVENNIQSALVMEDDTDWDINIHTQMQDFARASQLLLQPLPGMDDGFLDPTYHGDVEGQNPREFFVGEHQVAKPTTSPYGDLNRWDMLWIGHCGATIPNGEDGSKTPLGRAVLLNEPTVVDKQHINKEFGNGEWVDQYPAFSRLVFRTGGNVCTLAYGISLQGARRMLYELGIKRMNSEIDLELDAFCRGRDDRPLATCLTALPQYFQHHRPVGSWSAMSEISELSDDYNSHPLTTNIRHSTRINFPKLLEGSTDYIELFKDGEPPTGL